MNATTLQYKAARFIRAMGHCCNTSRSAGGAIVQNLHPRARPAAGAAVVAVVTTAAARP